MLQAGSTAAHWSGMINYCPCASRDFPAKTCQNETSCFHKAPTVESYSACGPLKPPHPSLLCHYWATPHLYLQTHAGFPCCWNSCRKNLVYLLVLGRNVPAVNANSPTQAPGETQKTSELWQFPEKPLCWFSSSIQARVRFVTAPEIILMSPSHATMTHMLFF